MKFTAKYPTSVGGLLLASDGENLTGLWLDGQKYYAAGLNADAAHSDSLPIFYQVKRWLDDYFAGKNPNPHRLPLSFGDSRFRQEIWKLLLEIPYGEVVTYGQLAKRYEARFGRKTAARAVGGAVGHNPISIIVPCHRVVGADGSLIGYAGGVEMKQSLLCLERNKG